jgi:hypothetical protein
MRLVSAAAGLVGFLLLLAFGAYAFFSPSIETPGAVLGVLGVLGLGTWLWLDRDLLRRAAQSQGARFTAAAILVVVITAAIAVALNVLAHRYDDRIDLTEAGTYTLSPETEKIVKALDRPVEVIAFVSESTPEKGRIDDLIASYKALSDKLTVRELDPVRNPMEAEQNKITSDLATGHPRLGLGSAARREHGERGVDHERDRAAHVGEGAPDLHDDRTPRARRRGRLQPVGDGRGAHEAPRAQLQGRQGEPREGSDRRGGERSCEVLIAADPQTDFLPMEREIVARFVAEGHSFLLLLDPTHAPALAKDMARYGITVDDDIVVEDNPDMQVAGMDASYIVLDAATFDYHPLTEGLKGWCSSASRDRCARHRRRGADPAADTGFKVQEVAKTSVHGWGEMTLDMSKALQPDPGRTSSGRCRCWS